jgi:hypothetical protein
MAKAEWQGTTRFVEKLLSILEQEQPMTIRQLFYRAVSAGEIGNDLRNYKRVSRVMTKVREDGRCPFEWIVDRSRPAYEPTVWGDPYGYAATVQTSYRKDHWFLQPQHVECWTEKDAIIGSIAGVTDELGVTVRVCRGFLSATKAHEIAVILAAIKKPKTVFYLGDHDPSGRCIEQEARNRILSYGSGCFKLQRLAIHVADIKKFNLPPLRVKPTDSRTASFLSRYSDKCVELDALPPAELRRRVRTAIEGLLNIAAWNRSLEVEQAELTSIVETVSQWPNLRADRPDK